VSGRAAGTAPVMSDESETSQPNAGQQPERATSVGQTGGLPGANADPRTAEMDDLELQDTVAGDGSDDDVPDGYAGPGTTNGGET